MKFRHKESDPRSSGMSEMQKAMSRKEIVKYISKFK